MTELVVCWVALSCWNQVCFRITWHVLNFKKKKKKKSFWHIFIPHRINTNNLSVFVFGKKQSDEVVLWNGAPHCNPFRMQWFCNLPIWIQRLVMFCLHTRPFNSKCGSSQKKVSCLPVIANAKTVYKNLYVWQNQFLLTLEQFAVCRSDNHDHEI